MNKYTRLYLNYTKCGPFFNDYMGEFLVSIYIPGESGRQAAVRPFWEGRLAFSSICFKRIVSQACIGL